MSRLIFVTHPEVVIDPNVPIPEWPLSVVGLQRMERFVEAIAGHPVTAIYASTEQKALDGAQIIADHFGLEVRRDHALGENDRSSTGYIAPPEFWEVVEQFFGKPHESIRGWERAIDAQKRIVDVVTRIDREEQSRGDIIIVAHGAVGCLLTAHLQNVSIGQESRPTHSGGGCYLVIDRQPLSFRSGWHEIEDVSGLA